MGNFILITTHFKNIVTFASMGIRKLKSASSISIKRRPNKRQQRETLVHMTADIFGNDLIKGALKDNRDVKNILNTIDTRYAEFVEERVQEIIERKYKVKFESKAECLLWIEEHCTLLRSDEDNPANVLYFDYKGKKHKELAFWRDSPEAVKHLTKEVDHSIEEE